MEDSPRPEFDIPAPETISFVWLVLWCSVLCTVDSGISFDIPVCISEQYVSSN